MKTKEDHCVDCGLPCIGEACPHMNVIVAYCDDCGSYADYCIDNRDLCAECAKSYVDGIWGDLSICEKSKLLDVSCEFNE